MGMLAAELSLPHSWRMPESEEKTERQVWGAAVRALRIRVGLTLHEAAIAYEPDGYTPGDPNKGLSVQRWQQIEKGALKFTLDQRRRLAKAMDADVEELELERARILGHRPRRPARGFEESGDNRGLVIPIYGRAELDADGWKVKDAETAEGFFDLRELMGPSIGVTQVADDGMGDKAQPGATVIFDRSRRPQAGKGCVVETTSGEMYVRLFEGLDDEHLVVRSMAGKPTEFKRAAIKGVYAVKFWGD